MGFRFKIKNIYGISEDGWEVEVEEYS